MLYVIKILQARIWKWDIESFVLICVWELATNNSAFLFCFPGIFIVDFLLFPGILAASYDRIRTDQTKTSPHPL